MTRLKDYRKLTAAQQRDVDDACVTQEQWRKQQEQERLERRARQVMADIAYRQALGLPLGEPLPKALGSSGGPRRAGGSLRATRHLSGGAA